MPVSPSGDVPVALCVCVCARARERAACVRACVRASVCIHPWIINPLGLCLSAGTERVPMCRTTTRTTLRRALITRRSSRWKLRRRASPVAPPACVCGVRVPRQARANVSHLRARMLACSHARCVPESASSLVVSPRTQGAAAAAAKPAPGAGGTALHALPGQDSSSSTRDAQNDTVQVAVLGGVR